MSERLSTKIDTDIVRRNLLKYTRKAFEMLPEMENPSILDLGCGTGLPTIELAKLSGGNVVGVDIDQSRLDKLVQAIEEEHLEDRVQAVRCSMMNMNFDNGCFDIIWAEGSISAIGFRRGLLEFKRLLKPGGCFVIHDELKDLNIKLELISDCGYELLGYFRLPRDIWEREYYGPLKAALDDLWAEHSAELKHSHEQKQLRQEIEDFRRNPEAFQSVFFIMQKRI